VGSLGVGGPGEGARLPCADEDCGQRAVAELGPAPASAHRTERAGETSREPVSLPRRDTMRMCRGCLRAAVVNGADVDGGRPRGSSSTESIGGVEASGTDKLGTTGAGADGLAAGVALNSEVDMPFGAVGGKRE
jgi:hypothetical protein